MKIESFRTPGLGDQSYLLTHEGIGVLVDPQRDVDRFIDAADAQGVDVRFVLETHLHNDYVSGGVEAARLTGAELVLPAAAAPAYDHRAAYHLEDIEGPGLTLRPIHTPGHTPEHTSYAVIIEGRPVAVFSGGSLLVGSAGRPDLLGPARARSLGKLQWRSVNRLAELPDDVELLPTHGEGSFCTVSGTGSYTSTIGVEKADNPVLQTATADEMADLLLAQPMPIPAFYQHMGPANTLGVPDIRRGPVPSLSVAALELLPDDTTVIDIRPRAEQAAGYLPGSLTIEFADDFGSWAAWLAPHGAPIVLVANANDDRAAQAVTQLAQVGVDDVRGVITDLSDARLKTFELRELDAFRPLVDGTAPVLDVRMPSEHRAEPMPGAIEKFLPELLSDGLPADIDGARRVLLACGSGRRASIAASILGARGISTVVLDGASAGELARTAVAA